jgi:hypothetical protein
VSLFWAVTGILKRRTNVLESFTAKSMLLELDVFEIFGAISVCFLWSQKISITPEYL